MRGEYTDTYVDSLNENDPKLVRAALFRHLCPQMVQLVSLSCEHEVAYKFLSNIKDDLMKQIKNLVLSPTDEGTSADDENTPRQTISTTIEEMELVGPNLVQVKGLAKKNNGYNGWGPIPFETMA